MNTVGLTSMTAALSHINKVDQWNSYQGVTCLAPASGVSIGTDPSSLELVLDGHTLLGPQYTPAMQDGQEFMSKANTTVRVTVRDGTVWFNDAKVVRANVIANNGVIHVLDKAMSPNGTAPASSSTATSTSTPNPTSKSSGAPSAPISSRDIFILCCFMSVFMSVFT
ncbi:hypothetical protein GP486_004605 [Trichoglossum hirsutum]|uniref:FAS1 domain-containing protein n=1 Tax=Trichoglossum hirsutum TaxID=265104 RepID=A0A9P8RPF5_9PEZI|nr:hypothetical protein GP486_004605 [Trichoglossum hirsutum]